MHASYESHMAGPQERTCSRRILLGGLPDHLLKALDAILIRECLTGGGVVKVESKSEVSAELRRGDISAAVLPLRWADQLTRERLGMLSGTNALICFEDQCGLLPIAEYCEVFSSGVSYLFDCSDDDFLPSVVQVLRSIDGRESGEPELAMKMWWRLFGELGVVGQSPEINRVYEQIGRAARASDVPTLLLGETGTGKQVFAEALHRMDPKRRSHPFVAVNCATITHSLAESDLFGHQKGSFTGASDQRKGYFRASDGGTLFLDEIGDLDPRLQPKLLRALEQKTVMPVGADREHRVDFRLVSATNSNLQAMIGDGRFRRDLFERLNVATVIIPPLRERAADIAPLVAHFAAKHGWKVTKVDGRVVDALLATGLPGNVRELENIVRRSLLARKTSWNDQFSVSCLPPDVLTRVAAGIRVESITAGFDERLPGYLLDKVVSSKFSYSEVIAFCDDALVAEALRRTNGGRRAAARMLRVSERTIFNKIRKGGPEHRSPTKTPPGTASLSIFSEGTTAAALAASSGRS